MHREAPVTLAALFAACALLAGCGGGGGSAASEPVAGTPAPSPSPAPMPNAPTAAITSSQAAAAALVTDTLQRSRDMRLASGLTSGVQTGASGTGPSMVDILTRSHILSVADYSSTLCSSGKSTIEVADAVLARFQADPNAQMAVGDTITLTSTQCVVKAAVELGTVALGDFGVGSKVDGKFALQMVSRSGSDAVFTMAYTGFSYTPFGGAAFAPLDAVLRFGTEAGVNVYSLDIPNTRFTATPKVSSAGNGVTVTAGSLRGLAPAAVGSGYIDYSFSVWTFDSVLAQGASGTVRVTGSGGTSAVITVVGNSYNVAITVGARTDSYLVAR
jgi:hypothetical protein